MPDREHDVVVFGATGFTGALTARYLAEHAGPETGWALAGRNRSKLEAVRERLGVDVPLVSADIEDARSMRALAASTTRPDRRAAREGLVQGPVRRRGRSASPTTTCPTSPARSRPPRPWATP